jgi:hypothetical protein
VADINRDRVVNGGDLATLLTEWAGGGGAADIDRDGDVTGGDLAIMLSAWGTCP